MFKQLTIDAEISIVGKIKNQALQNKFNSIIQGHSNIFSQAIFQMNSLMEAYDNHNILILPSYTEGSLMLLTSLLQKTSSSNF